MKKKHKSIPKFSSLQEEQKFWDKHSFLDFPDYFKEITMDLSSLKPSTSRVTFRLPESMLYELKIMANKRDIPYQSFIKTILADRITQDQRVSALS